MAGLAALVGLVALMPAASAQTGVYGDDFEAYRTQADPPGWFDSSPGKPSNEAPGLYKTWPDPVAGSNTVFGKKGASSSFTHYRGLTIGVGDLFRFEGRMLRTKDKAHLGVTLLSGFPDPDAYYLLAQTTDAGNVTLGATGAGPLSGDVDADVSMTPNVWYRFALRAYAQGGGLRILAKVWPDGEPEPAAWAIDASDSASPLPAPGAAPWIGLWGEDAGAKYWDDLVVARDDAPPVITILESGAELADGSLFNRTVVPIIEVVDASPVVVTATLNGDPYTSGTPVAAEGVYELVVVATDVYGNSASKTVGFEIDLTPPVFLFVLPRDGTIAAITEVTLTGQVEGAVSVSVDGVPVPLTGLDFTAGPFPLAEGERVFRLSATDLAGNVARLDHTIIRDTIAPVVSISQPAPGVLGSSPITVSGTATDLHLTEVRVNGTPAALSGSSFSLDGVELAEGENTIVAEAFDAAGNSGKAEVTVTLDTIPPAITILNGSAPLPDGFLTNGVVVPVVEVDDATPVSVEILLNGSPFVSGTPVDLEGIFQLSVTATDAAGNSAAASVTFEIDRTPPVFIDVRPPAGSILATPEVTLEGEVSGADSLTVNGVPATLVGESFTAGPLPLVPGDNLFTLVATDRAGNSTELEHLLVLDNVPPVITITEGGAPLVDGALFNRTVVPVVDVQDDSPVTVDIRLDGQPFVSGTPVSAEGVYQLTVDAVDAAGNAAAAAVGFEIDLTPPEFLSVQPADGTITADPQVTLTGEVEGAVAVTVDGAPAALAGTSFSAGPFTLVEGDNVFLLAAVDAAGNQAQQPHRIILDTTPPVVEIVQPSAAVVGSSPITVSGTAVDLHLDRVLVNGVPAQLSGATFTLAGVPLTEGSNLLVAEAVDVVGNADQDEKTVVLDTIPPVITVLDGGVPLADGLLTNQTVTPVVEVDDATATDVEITLNGAPFVSGTPVDSEGVYTLLVLATDAAGNSASLSLGFEIDLTPPEFVDVQPPDGTILGTTEVTLTGQVTGAVQATVDGTPAVLVGESFTAGPFTIAGTERTFQLVATDAAGNSAQLAHRLLVDTTPPVLTILAPADGAILATPSVDVSGTAVDPHLAQVLVNGLPATIAGDDFTLPALALVEGANVIQVEASDTVGNVATAQVTVVVDTLPPEIAVLESGAPLADGSLFNRAVTPVIEVNDETATTTVATLSGLPFVSGTTVAIDGVYELAVTATDAAGNASAVAIGFEIDTVPPVFVSIEPADGAITAAAEVTLIGQVTGAAELTVDGQPVPLLGESFSAGPFPLAEGERVWLLAATDAAGNLAERSHTIVRDSTPPVVSITAPSDGALLGTVSVDVSGTADDLHLTGVTVNGIEAAVTGNSYLARQVPLSEGANLLTAVGVDAAGNAGEAQVAVVLDTQPPTVAITDPASGSLLAASTVAVTGTAADPHLDRVEVNGVGATLAGGSWSLVVPLAEGPNDLVAVAFDRLGNNAQDAVTVTRDLTAPELQITSPAEGALLNVETSDVTGTVDDEPGITVTVNGIAAAVDAGTFTAVDVPLVEGENRLIGRAVDALGNTGIRTRIVFRDTVAPSLLSADPADGALAVPPATLFRLTFSEELTPPAPGDWRLETEDGTAIPATAELAGEVLTVSPEQALPQAVGLRLVLTEALADLAGNPLANPQTLVYGVADTGAPDPPLVDPIPPPFLCAPRVALEGSGEPGTTLVVSGGAASLEAPVDESGSFAVQVELVPNLLNVLRLRIRDGSGNLSSEVETQVVQDCIAPFVVAARRDGDQFVATLSEPVDPVSVALAGAVTLSAADGPLAGAAAASADAVEAVFTPDAAPPAETLRFEVAQLVRDRAGNVLAYPFSRIFGAGVGESFITGTVIDNSTGRPLAGARVTVVATGGAPLPEPQPEQTTEADGRFSLPVAAGTHEVTILRPGYTPVFRIATNQAQVGVDLFDPRLTPMAASQSFGGAGGTYRGEAGLTLSLPAGELAEDTPIAVTALQEQGLPALLPYGWSPRGAAWIDLDGAILATAATLTLPVESPDGVQLAVAALDLATLQWRVRRLATVENGAVTATTAVGEALVAVEADGGPLAPPAATAGTILGSSPQPAGTEVETAQLSFDPEVVLPAQRSLATAGYTLNADAASGLPLTLVIQEELELLDGSTRAAAPYQADLVLYRAPDGSPRSRFFLQPSEAARLLPLSLGREDVTLRRFAGESVRGNVLGPNGGTVTDDEGDRLDVPAGAFAEPTAVLLRRGEAADLPLPAPAEGQLDGVLEIDAGGRSWGPPAGLSLAMDPAPAAGEYGVLLELVELDSGAAYRAVAALEATAEGWTTAAIDPPDLPWPGVRGDGTYLFLRHTQDVAYLRGTVFDYTGAPLAGALVGAAGVSWIQLSGIAGSYVLPVPLGSVTVTADNDATGNAVSVAVSPAIARERLDLDLTMVVVAPSVVAITPPDGAVDVPPGVSPTVQFSEAVDPLSLAGSIELRQEGAPVQVSFDTRGALVTVLPEATLIPGTATELTVGTGVRDLQGFPLVAPASSAFTTLRVLFNEDVDLTKVVLLEPDANGFATVIGSPGAVPFGTLVVVENTTSFVTTPSVEAGQDGSFELQIEATVADRLVLQVILEGSNTLVLELTPFRTADGKGAYMGPEGGRFATVDEIVVTVEQGTFDEPALVRVEPQAVEAVTVPVPEGLAPVYGFTLDLGGAQANNGLRVSVPAPQASPDVQYLLTRVVETFRGKKWMMDDLGRFEDGRFTTEDETVGEPGSGAPLAAGPESGAPKTATEVSIQRLQASTLAAIDDLPLVRQRRLEAGMALGSGGGPVAMAGPEGSPSTPRHLLPGMHSPVGRRSYQFWEALDPLGYSALPLIPNVLYFSPTMGMAAAVDAAVTRIMAPRTASIIMPSRLQQPFDVEARDLTTGFKLFEDVFDPPPGPGEIVELPVDTTVADTEPPAPVGGSPLRLLLIEEAGQQQVLVAPGIEVTSANGTLAVTGQPDSVQEDVKVRLLSLDSDGESFTTSSGTGAFTLSRPAETGERFVLAIGVRVPTDQVFLLEFSEALDEDLSGIQVTDLDGKDMDPFIEAVGTRETVQITPRTGWLAGESYLLKLTAELTDGADNAWGKELEIRFEVEQSEVLDTYELGDARDMVRLGSLLFVAGASQGLVILDASDPTDIKNLIPNDITFPFILSASVRGVAVDPHGRVLVVGGGDRTVGQMLILDPLDLDPEAIAANPDDLDVRYAAFKGNTIVSNNPGGIAPNLPAGTPRRTAILSNDDSETWRIGEEAPPGGITVTPAQPPADGSDYQITIDGTGGSPGLPVTVRDLEGGRWNRVDAGDTGNFNLTLTVSPGNTLEVLKNRNTVAYVAVNNAGVAAVDVNAFYNEPADNPIKSDVVGFFTGENANITFCDEQIPGLGAVLNVGVLSDEENPVPLAIPTLVFWKGLEMIESSPSSPGAMQHLTNRCITEEGSQQVVGLDVLPDFAFDLDEDGMLEEEERRDYLVIGHARGGILIYDVSNRGAPGKVATIKLPGNVNHVTVDRRNRRVFGAGYGGGLWVVDLNAPLSNGFEDLNADLKDDRILESIELEGTTKSPMVIDPELGLVYVGGNGRGLTAVSVDEPLLTAIARKPDGGRRIITRVAPYGVPTAPDGEPGADGEEPPDQVGSFRVLASLPGFSGNEIELDLESLGPGGLPIDGAGDPDVIDGLPRVSFTDADTLKLTRLSEVQTDTGYQLYVSKEIAVVADLRAARDYERSSDEQDEELCPRCDQSVDDVADDALQLLSGDKIKVSFPQQVRAQLAPIYSDSRLDAAELELDSVRWEMSPAVRQEPTQNPNYGSGDVVPGTLLHSGEFSHAVTDLSVRARGMDFSFGRIHRTQTVGNGPCGPGCEISYRQRLRERPDGDVEFYDGRGRRELFEKMEGEENRFDSPPGRFAELRRTADGFLMIDARRNLARFDRFGRLASLADSLKESEDTGNEMRFSYDLVSRLTKITDTLDRDYILEYDDEGRLTKISDFDGRDVLYEYDDDGRLSDVGSPEVSSGGPSGRLTTTHAYEAASGALTVVLNARDNLTSLTDARNNEWLALVYGDDDGDGRNDEVSTQTWGDNSLQISYDFGGRTATVTDRRGNPWSYSHDEDGHLERLVDPGQHQTTFEFNDDGLVKKMTSALGRVTEYVYDGGDNPRSRGNATSVTVTPGSGGANGSADSLVTRIEYDPVTNQPTLITDPRGAVTSLSRDSFGLARTISKPESATTTIEYNGFGQPVRITNPNNRVTTYDYHEGGSKKGYLRLVTVDPDGLGLVAQYETDERGNTTAVIDPRGVRHTAEYNELDWLVTSTDAAGPSADGQAGLGYETRFIYDNGGNLIEKQRPFGTGAGHLSDRMQYGKLNELELIEREIGGGAGVAREVRTYDANLNLKSITDPVGNVTAITHDGRNLVSQVVRGDGSPAALTEIVAHDAERQLTHLTNGRNQTWVTEYDGFGRISERRDPLGNRLTIGYDDSDNPVSTKSYDSDGNLLAEGTVEFDLLNRLTKNKEMLWGAAGPGSARVLEEVTSYDPGSNVTGITDLQGRKTTFDYDTADRVVAKIDPAGNRADYTLDANGNTTNLLLTEVLSAGGSVQTSMDYVYDALDRRISQSDGLDNTTRFSWDARDNMVQSIDPANLLTVHAYDGLGNRTSTTRPEGVAEILGWDAASRLVSYKDAVNPPTLYGYDALNRNTSVTYPDGTSETYAYDAAHNVVRITDPNGSVVIQDFDPANRLVERQIQRGNGVEGPQLETYDWDGLYRPTEANSSGVVTDMVWDSLSRLVSETTSNGTVSFTLDDAGNVTSMLYPSGYQPTRFFDRLDRLTSVTGAVDYGYRGPDLMATRSFPSGILGDMSYDSARRLIEQNYAGADGQLALSERLAWSPRGLKVAVSRPDIDAGLVLGYDGAGRVTRVARDAAAAAGITNNSTPTVGTFADGFELFYDSAQNLLRRTQIRDEISETTALPPDGSNRNRPGAVGGEELQWDANGNLIKKGDLQFTYDYRNRLTRVLGPAGELASYEYDAFNRRVSRTVGEVVRDTVWAGWQPIEEYIDGVLSSRRTYGARLDELVRLESDVDGDGTLEGTYTPLFDSSGNLSVIAGADGRPLERYDYSPFGQQTITADLLAPAVQQLRTQNGTLWIELTEGVLAAPLQAAVDGGTFALEGAGDIAVNQPVQGGRQAGQRLVVEPALPVAAGTSVTLSIPAGSLVDDFLNTSALDFVFTFAWPDGDALIQDTAAPRVLAVQVKEQALEVQLSEEADLIAAAAAIQLDGQATQWTLDASRYTLISTATLAAGSHQLDIGTGPLDLSGRGVDVPLSLSFESRASSEGCPPLTTCVGAGSGSVFEAPDDAELASSAVGNPFGFHGLPVDGETGFVYFRNRYYDPELGRFISADPAGHLDGPSLYSFAGNDPINNSDPLGLYCPSCTRQQIERARAEEERRRREELQTLLNSVEGYLSEHAGEPSAQIREGLAAHLKSEGFVSGPSYEAHRLVTALLGPGNCDGSRHVICHLQGLGKYAEGMEFVVVNVSMLAASEFAGAQLAAILSRGGSYAAMIEAIQADIKLAQSLSRRQTLAHLAAGKAKELELLAAQGKAPNNLVWRPSLEQMDSATFRVVVGEPKFTPKGVPRGTKLDSVTGGFLEIKHGTSTLTSSYQLRLQVYRALVEGEKLTIQTSRPLSSSFSQLLQRWGVTVEKIAP